MTAAQIWNQDGPVPFWLVGWLVVPWLVICWPLACWLVACRSGAKDWVLISGSPILSGYSVDSSTFGHTESKNPRETP